MLEPSLGKLTPCQQHHSDIPHVPNLRSLKAILLQVWDSRGYCPSALLSVSG